MSENLSNFLADLGSDADLLARVMANPETALAETTLTPEERAAILSRDPREVGRVLGLNGTGHQVKKIGPKRKRPSILRPVSKKGGPGKKKR
jgi:hypothetical protein